VIVDQNHARGVLNELLYPIDGAPDLSDATATRLVDNLIDGRLYATPVADFAAAIDRTLRAGALHPQTAAMSRRYAEPDLLEFLARVARELDERRPWPPPKFTKRDVAEWATFAAATPIARIDRPRHQVSGAVGYAFDDVPAGSDKLPVLILHLRTGETVALLGGSDPGSTSFVLLQRDPGDPAEIVSHFQHLTGFRPTDVTAL
jgi:hypothetical protein